MTHFERLGLPQSFATDLAVLERNYLERSRAVHPDHTGNDPVSLEESASLNEAYAVLREPFRRAEYLLALAGGPTASAAHQPPPEFLEEMLELRMRIEEAKSDAGARADLEKSLLARKARLLEEVGGELREATGKPDVERLMRIRQTLNATKFINGLLRDLNEE